MLPNPKPGLGPLIDGAPRLGVIFGVFHPDAVDVVVLDLFDMALSIELLRTRPKLGCAIVVASDGFGEGDVVIWSLAAVAGVW